MVAGKGLDNSFAPAGKRTQLAVRRDSTEDLKAND
jgi:hypothetical protein